MAKSRSELPLRDKSVLVTRSADRGAALAERLRAMGARVELRATIAFEPPERRAPAREAVGRISDYDWLVFTSANGVRFFHELAAARYGDDFRPDAAVAAVGAATAEALSVRGLKPDLVATESRAEGLARSLLQRVTKGQSLLWVRPEVAREILPRALRGAGIRVDGVVFYRTVAAPDAGRVAADVAAGRYDAVVFSSPSTLSYLLEAAGTGGAKVREGLGRSRRVAIGGVTAAAMEEAGLRPDEVADSPDAEGVARAVARCFGPVERG